MAVLDKVLKAALDHGASDVHIVPGEPFTLRRLGKLVKLKSAPLTAEKGRQLIFELLSPEQRKVVEQTHQLDFAYALDGLARFRGSIMGHNNGLSAVFRIVPLKVPQLDRLGLPEVVAGVLDNHQGLILVTGATGQGKSTTLAAMVDTINSRRAHHILTVEDPIEFIHPVKRGVVNQRQLGANTRSYGNALRSALREDPDVIMIGELRDLETISLAISAAETGHLVIGTLATSGAAKTVDRIIDAYPADEQNQIRAMLSETLRAVITQRLLPGRENGGMELAAEVLIGTLPMTNLIKDGKTFQIPSMMQTARAAGMQSMDDAVQGLLREQRITARTAHDYANDPKKFKTQMEKEARG